MEIRKLQLDHIAPYFPYGAKVYFEGDDFTHDIVGINITSQPLELIFPLGDFVRSDFDNALLVLQPLAYLPNKITFNGEEFIPIDELKGFYGWDYLFNYTTNKQGRFNPYAVEYGCIVKLLEWHFDIYHLIDEGLRVDINTLNNH